MSHPILRLFAVGLLPVAFALSALAGGPSVSIKKGIYNGQWHGCKVKFDIEKVSKKGKFSGVMHFDPKGPFPNATAAFTGEIGPKGSIVIQPRRLAAGVPGSRAKRGDKFWQWTGETTGKGLDKAVPFELKIPH